MKNWEPTFQLWKQGPTDAEKERSSNAIEAIKAAISSSDKLRSREVNVFLQGSYRNNVNVRKDSDVDVGLVCTDTFFTRYPDGTNRGTFGNEASSYSFKQFKNEVEEALVGKFGREAVTRGNKAFDIKANAQRITSDATPFFQFRDYYDTTGRYTQGVALLPDRGGDRIYNFPEQHYKNGVRKNTNCNRRYKRLVRILKKLCTQMEDEGVPAARGIPGFLCECLIWNVHDSLLDFTDSYSNNLRSSLVYLYQKLGSEESGQWCEVSDLKYLFHPSQKWTKEQARRFIHAAWNYVGFQS